MKGAEGDDSKTVIEFLTVFIPELNALAEDGAVVLVEGKRDRDALVELGYAGPILTKASLHSEKGVAGLRSREARGDPYGPGRRGRRLAARYAELFQQRGIETSLTQRRRLLKASHGDVPSRGESCAFRSRCA